MEESYLIWSTKNSGWWTDAGNTSSDRKLAKTLGRNAAIAFCARHMADGLSEFGLLPIREDDLAGMGALRDQR